MVNSNSMNNRDDNTYDIVNDIGNYDNDSNNNNNGVYHVIHKCLTSDNDSSLVSCNVPICRHGVVSHNCSVVVYAAVSNEKCYVV